MSNDGGPAFSRNSRAPSVEDERGDRGATGMTLRDYFAAKAMHAYRSSHPNQDADIIAKWAYADADAMLKLRDGDEEQAR